VGGCRRSIADDLLGEYHAVHVTLPLTAMHLEVSVLKLLFQELADLLPELLLFFSETKFHLQLPHFTMWDAIRVL